MSDVPSCVLRDLLHQQARERPDQVYAAFEDGSTWTFAELLAQVQAVAAGLAALGVKQGDFVALWLSHGAVALRTWFAVNYLGAVAVPVNLAYKGRLLARVLDNSGARLMVLESALIDRLAALPVAERARLTTLVTVGAHTAHTAHTAPVPDGLQQVDEAALHTAGSASPEPPVPIRPTDLQVILYTSGTTGPSKGVLCSYLHLWTSGHNVYFLTAQDRYMVNLPLAHVSGVLPCMLMLALGGSIALVERFQTEQFWAQIHRSGATFVILLGAMAKFLLSRPVGDDERGHPLKKMLLLPFDMPIEPMRQRWGVDVYTSFNMTEVCCPIMSAPNPVALGSCGRLRPGIEARVADDEDFAVADGTVGELLLRTDTPWAFSHGYHQDAAATARAWRNGWFHTGDAFRRDADGNYYFVDRLKDTIRRRGENISSFEVEAELLAHPVVQEAAVVAVPSELGEDEVMAVLTTQPGQALDPAELLRFLVPRLPYFMVPRYVRVVAELPKTPTLKVEKHLLREQGLGADGVWDRERAGIHLGRNS